MKKYTFYMCCMLTSTMLCGMEKKEPAASPEPYISLPNMISKIWSTNQPVSSEDRQLIKKAFQQAQLKIEKHLTLNPADFDEARMNEMTDAQLQGKKKK